MKNLRGVKKTYLLIGMIIVLIIALLLMIIFLSDDLRHENTGKITLGFEGEKFLSVSVDIENSEVLVEEMLLVNTEIRDMNSEEAGDVLIEYFILDGYEKELFQCSKMIAVHTSASTIKKIFIPSTYPQGTYTLKVIVTQDNKKVEAKDTFYIERNSIFGKQENIIFIGGILVVMLAFIFLLSHEIRKIKKYLKLNKKVEEKMFFAPSKKKKK